MAGTIIGGRKAKETNYKKHGKDFYRIIGSKGGQQKTSKPKGFAANPALAKTAGSKGGRISKRKPGAEKKEKEFVWKGGPNAKLVFTSEEK